MQAFILAAGLGTRLQPLTNKRPKALVEIGGKSLLEIAINSLIRQGANRIIVNIHHFGDMIEKYILEHTWEAEILISDERDQLLDTGGGLKKASPLFRPNEPIVLYNVDILSTIDLTKMLIQHIDSMNIATLAVSERTTSRQLLFNTDKQLIGWQNQASSQTKWVTEPQDTYTPLAFSGISIVNPEMINLLPQIDHPYPIIPEYLIIAKNHRISYFKHDQQDWLDVGKPDTLELAQTLKDKFIR